MRTPRSTRAGWSGGPPLRCELLGGADKAMGLGDGAAVVSGPKLIKRKGEAAAPDQLLLQGTHGYGPALAGERTGSGQ